MHYCDLRLLPLIFLLLVVVSSGQNSIEVEAPKSPPGGLKLIDGYSWMPLLGKDAVVGRISNKDGFSITFDRSGVKGFFAQQFSNTDNLVWLKHQEVNGQQMDLGMFKDGVVVALFDKTTKFSAKPKSTSELDDFILIVMTYHQTDPKSKQ